MRVFDVCEMLPKCRNPVLDKNMFGQGILFVCEFVHPYKPQFVNKTANHEETVELLHSIGNPWEH